MYSSWERFGDQTHTGQDRWEEATLKKGAKSDSAQRYLPNNKVQATLMFRKKKTQTKCNKITADRSSLEIFVRCSLKFREDRGTEIAFEMKTSIVLSYSIKVSCFINIDTVTVLYFRSPWYGKCTTSPRHCDPYKDISHNVYNEGSIDKLLFEGANSSLYPD